MSYTRVNVGRTRKMVRLERCLPYGDTNHDILLKNEICIPYGKHLSSRTIFLVLPTLTLV